MVEIFKTNITTEDQAEQLIVKLAGIFFDTRFNMDLMDPDKVLRGESSSTIPWESIEEAVRREGFECCLIDY